MKLCPKCNKKIAASLKYCDECKAKWEKQKKNDVKFYDNNLRKNKDVYHDSRWIKLTGLCKARFIGLDIYSYYVLGERKYGSLSHHIETVEENKKRAFDLENLIYVSDESHRAIHKAYNEGEYSKKVMQRLLFSLIERWKKEYQ